MKVVIVGYGEMLEALCLGINDSKHDIVGVFRSQNLKRTKLKRFLFDLFLPSDDLRLIKTLYLYDIKAPSVNSKQFREEINKLKADIIIVGSWSEKLSEETINSPKICSVNVHPALLPKYRGPNPYFNVILNGEDKTGITYHLIDKNYDSGNILKQFEIPVSENETGKSLKYKCCSKVQNTVEEVLNNIDELIKNSTKQNEDEASYFPQINLKDSILDFTSETSEEISKRIRALNPWLKCYIPYKNEFFTFEDFKITAEKSQKTAGTIVNKTENSLSIVCKDSNIIEFKGLLIVRAFCKQITKFYLKHCVKIDTSAV